MASRNSVSGSGRFSSALSSAVFEWILILLLFVDASLSYLVTKFSRLCKLQTPCILCSRLDHLLGSEKLGIYTDLICDAHKLEISSLAFCHVHQKLADVHTMCETCLLSFATENKSNAETCRSLVGKLGLNLENIEDSHQLIAGGDGNDPDVFQADDLAKDPLMKDYMSSYSLARNCSCCCNPFRLKPHAVSSLQDKNISINGREINISAASSSRLGTIHHENGLGKTWKSSVNSSVTQLTSGQGGDRFSHIGYSEVKVTSDSESEVPLSDDDNGNALPADNSKEVFSSVHLESEPLILVQDNLSAPLTDDINANALLIAADNLKEVFASVYPESEPLIVVQDNLSASRESDLAPEMLIAPSPLILETSELLPAEQLDDREPCEFSLPGKGSEENYRNQIDSEADSSQFNIKPQDEEVSNTKDNLGSSNLAWVATTSPVDVVMDWSSNKVNLKTNHDTNEPGPSMSTHMDLDDTYKLAVDVRECSMSPTSDVTKKKDHFGVQEDQKLSQLSALPEVESSWNELNSSPRVYGEGDELVLQNISKRLPMERNESGFESREGSIVSEIEGETTVERLKRQIELDRKSISLLYEELEEERNAAADAANQAMAMITKLQEEKAAMQMEALQYQREMEEQAEFDQEALRTCDEQLAEKEQQIQDLVAEMELLKNQFVDESPSNNLLEQFSSHTRKMLDDTNAISKELGSLKNPIQCFEDEKMYIADCLKKLEKTLHLVSKKCGYLDVSSSDVDEDELPNGVPKGKDCTQFYGASESDVRMNGHYSDEAGVTGGSAHPREEYSSQENGQAGGFLVEDGPDGICVNANGEDCIHFYNVSERDVRINGQYSDEAAATGSSQYPHQEEFSQENSQTGEFSEKKYSSLSEEWLHSTTSSISVKGSQLVHESNHHRLKNKREYVGKRNDFVSLDNEVFHLRQRLEALELDRDILEHAINALRNGDDGVQFIQEIACSLRELRRTGIMQQEHLLA